MPEARPDLTSAEARHPLADPLLPELILAAGVSGRERPVRALLRRAVEPLAEVRVDSMGNLLARLPGRPGPRLLLTAHLDEVGLQVGRICTDGSLACRKIGGIDDRALPGRHVRVHGRTGPIPGVIGYAPPDLAFARRDRPDVTPSADLRVDVGARSADEARGLGVEPAATMSFHRAVRLLNGRRLVGRGIDDRICCYALLELLRLLAADAGRPEVHFAWTTQNEIGLRGSQAVARREPPFDVVLHVAAFGTSDGPGYPTPLSYARLGGGPVLRVFAGDSLASPGLAGRATALARAHGLAFPHSGTGGETEAKWFQLGGAAGISVNIPVRHLHSDVEMIDWGDYEALLRLLRLLVESGPALIQGV